MTGASRGIGTAIARRLAAEGATVACTARTMEPDPRYPGTLQETVAMIEAAGGRAAAFKADLSNGDDRSRLVNDVRSAFGGIDILVNNAAVTFFLPIDTFPEKRFRLMIETQVWSTIDLAQQVIPDMRSRGAGWILNISSRAAVKPMGPPFEEFYKTGNSSVYGLCKAALERLSLGMAAELFDDNIAVNTLAP
ncbi:MAG: SDR family NAD(P)-dependent oxidoreductase, partial [Acidimicrobiia bacterium]|nr:SDR family NAD(P)-dependent oxidoreductase [Acidimicrobiia bacterium]